MSHWSRDVQFGPDDVVVFYFAGHALVEDRDRHYLLCWDSVEDDPTATALATEDVLRILVRSGIGNVLFVLDTCYGGAGLRDAVQVALRGIARRSSDAVTTGMWFVSSARARDEAVDGALVDVLPDALAEVGERTGQRQRYLDLVDVVEALNRRFAARGLGQRAELTAGMVTGLAPFLRNRGYRDDLPREDTDLELQRRFARRELHDRLAPHRLERLAGTFGGEAVRLRLRDGDGLLRRAREGGHAQEQRHTHREEKYSDDEERDHR